MYKDNEIKAQIALGTLRLIDITPDVIKIIQDKNLLIQLNKLFCMNWEKLWYKWDHDNDPWPFDSTYSFTTFLETAKLLYEHLNDGEIFTPKYFHDRVQVHRQQYIKLVVEKWQFEYDYLFHNEQ